MGSRNQVRRRTRGPGPRVGRGEMRKQQVTMFVSLLLMVVVAAAAQTPSQLDRVNVIRDTDTIRVEMKANGTLAPKLSTLDSPARVVVDLPETVMATGQTRIAVGAAGV